MCATMSLIMIKTFLLALLLQFPTTERSDHTITWQGIQPDPVLGIFAGYKVRYGRSPGVDQVYATEEYTGFGGEPKFTFWGLYHGVHYYAAWLPFYARDGVYVDGPVSEEIHIYLEPSTSGLPKPENVRVELK